MEMRTGDDPDEGDKEQRREAINADDSGLRKEAWNEIWQI